MSVGGGDNMTLPARIKYVQGQMRIAILNHSVSWQRLIHSPDNLEVENMLKMLQNIILSLGRRQTELMYLYKRDLRLKYPGDEEMQNKISMDQLGWPDRYDDMRLPNGSDAAKKSTVQVVRRNPNIQLGRPNQKMTSLLKPPVKTNLGNAVQQLQRKESERLKAAAAKQSEIATPAISKKFVPAQKPKIVLNSSTRRTSNDKLSDSDSFPELKESELAGYKPTPQDKATDLGELSQDQYLGFFGLVNKDKSKSMVVSQTKRKRRSAAGQSDFYKDFFQPKRPYNRKTLMTDTESPASSQEITEVDSSEFSPPCEKPSVPPLPASSCSTELLEETTPRDGSPAGESVENVADCQNKVAAKPDEPQSVGELMEAPKAVDPSAEESSDRPADSPLLSTLLAKRSDVSPTKASAVIVEKHPTETAAADVEKSLSVPEDPSISAENPQLAVDESSSSAENPSHVAEESPIPAEKSLSAAEAGKPLTSPEKPLISAENHSYPAESEEPLCSGQDPPSAADPEELLSSGQNPLLDVKESPLPDASPSPISEHDKPDSAANVPSPDDGKSSISAPDESAVAKLDDSVRTDGVDDCETPQDESAPPSPTNEDDEDGEDGDSSLSPADMLENETYKTPAEIDHRKMESVSSLGDESIGEAGGVDISAMIGENVQYFSADAEDCSEMVNRYRLEGQSDGSQDNDEEVEAEEA